MSIALIIALVSFEERCIATFPIKTNLLRGEQVSQKSDSHKKCIHDLKNSCKIIHNTLYTFVSYRIDSTLGARHH